MFLRKGLYREVVMVVSVSLLLIVLFGCSGRGSLKEEVPFVPSPDLSYPNPNCPEQGCSSGTQVIIAGLFTVIQNGHTIYRLSNEQGLSVELLIDEALLKPYGGARALDRKHVTVVGEWTADQPAKIRVITIRPNK